MLLVHLWSGWAAAAQSMKNRGHGRVLDGAPGVTRTRGTQIRNLVLYPPELGGQGWVRKECYEKLKAMSSPVLVS